MYAKLVAAITAVRIWLNHDGMYLGAIVAASGAVYAVLGALKPGMCLFAMGMAIAACGCLPTWIPTPKKNA